jgi:hypothetical protein
MRTADARLGEIVGVTEEVLLVLADGTPQRAVVPLSMFVLPGISKQYTIILGNAVHKRLNAWVDPARAVYCFNTDAGDRAEIPIALRQTGSLASTRDAATVTFNAAALGASVTPLPSGSPRQQLRRVRRLELAETPAVLLHHVLSYCRQRSDQPPPPAGGAAFRGCWC